MADTFKLSVTLPTSHAFTRAGIAYAFNVESIKTHADIVAQLVLHGLTQKIGDAAAGAKKDAQAAYESDNGAGSWEQLGEDEQAELVADAARAAMDSVAEALADGDWGRTREASDTDPLDRFRANVVRQLFKLPANATHGLAYKRRFGAKTVDVPYINELLGKDADYEPTDGDIAKARTMHLIKLGASGELVDKAGNAVSAAGIDKAAEIGKAAEDKRRAAERAAIDALSDLSPDV